MRWTLRIGCTVLGCLLLRAGAWSQTARPASPLEAVPAAAVSADAPLPDVETLLGQVERSQKRLEALQKDYTYHVHTDQQELDKAGSVKKTETQDAESLTVDGVRVNRLVARNGVPLTAKEAEKESARLDADVAKAKERRAKLAAEGSDSDARGDAVLPLSRILELGSFSHPRREEQGGRPVIVVDYAGNPKAKTHSPFEGVVRDMVGTLWIDESDRVMVRAEGRFLNDFKLGGGLMADVQKGTRFAYSATRVGDGVWLPATVDGQGAVRVLLFAHFSGRLHLVTSDYRRFRASATIVGSHGAIGEDGTPVEGPAVPGTGSAPSPGGGASGKPGGQTPGKTPGS